MRDRTVTALREWLHQRSRGGALTDLDLLKVCLYVLYEVNYSFFVAIVTGTAYCARLAEHSHAFFFPIFLLAALHVSGVPSACSFQESMR